MNSTDWEELFWKACAEHDRKKNLALLERNMLFVSKSVLIVKAAIVEPICRAAETDDVAFLERIFRAGNRGVIDYCDMKGFTPLMHAAANGQTEAIKCLLMHNANPAMVCKQGKTALDYACSGGYRSSIEILTRKTLYGI